MLTTSSALVPKSFRRLARCIDETDDLIRDVLEVDRVFFPGTDVSAAADRIAELGREFAARVSPDLDAGSRFLHLGSFLGDELDFRGGRSDFSNPDYAFASKVLDSRRGLPITLSAIYLGVGRHAGVAVSGIALPGHFIVAHLDSPTPLFLDPFRGGQPLSKRACDRIVRDVTGGQATSIQRFLEPTLPRALLTRMLNNLQMIYWNRRDNVLGLLAARLLCTLNPSAADPIKVRGYFYDRLGETRSALVDYESYLRRASDAPDARQLKRRIAYLRESSRESGRA